MELWSLGGKSFLVIDDLPDMRAMMRSMLAAYGAQNIKQAKDGKEAMEMLAVHRFDVVLCDYNLGDGKDGQQILEEAKHRNLLPQATIFIMVTAENTSMMVLGALEHQPDDYLAKPVTKTVLQARLKKLMDKKAALKEVYAAVDGKDYHRALALCDQYIQGMPQYRFELTKLKCDLLLDTGDYAAAEELCNAVLGERDVPWALFNLGKAHFHRRRHEDAQRVFVDLIEANPSFVAGYDWLAKTRAQLNDSKGAQEALLEAVAKSPKSLLRQRSLGEIADKNEDFKIAEKARRDALRVSKGSVLRVPSDFTGLAKVLAKNKNTKEAMTVLDSVKYEFQNSPEAALAAAVTEGFIHRESGNEAKSAECFKKALELMPRQTQPLSSELGMDLAKACIAMGKADEAAELLGALVKNNHDDEELLKQVDEVFAGAGEQGKGQEIITKAKREIVEVNNQGVKLAKEGKIDEAVELFTKALKGMPTNVVINLNAAEAMIVAMQKSGPDRRRLAAAMKCLDATRDAGKHGERWQKLMAEWRQLAAQVPQGAAVPKRA